jgi:hypothetical protein
LEAIAEEADRRLSTLAEHYGDRMVESLGEHELAQFGEAATGEAASPFDAQEDFLKKLMRKVKSVAHGVVKLAKKGLSTIGRFLPIGKLLGAVKKLIRPLLRHVLRRAIGRLPAAVQPAARKLAQRFGLQTESGSETAESNEYGHLGEELSAEFDAQLASHLLAADEAQAQAALSDYEASAQAAGERTDVVAILDDGRRALSDFFESAEQQADPTAAMENFVPAVLPLIKLGISIVGREKVVKLVAGLIGNLIRPMVGSQLSPVLSQAVASSGLSLIGLEAPVDGARLGAETLTSVAEDTVRQVFAASPAVLGNELLTAAVVHEAFTDAVARHMPDAVLRAEVVGEHPDHDAGVWVLMPRGRARQYRYRAFSRRIPILVRRPMARHVILSDGETLEERLLEAGVEAFPAELELEVFETLPGGELGHVLGAEFNESVTGGLGELASQFEELDEASALNTLLPRKVGSYTHHGRGGHRGGPRRFVRMRVRGVPLHRGSPLSVRLHFADGKPVLTATVRLGERRAHAMAQMLCGRQHVAVVRDFQRWVRGPLRTALSHRLRRVFARRGLSDAEHTVDAVADRLADAIAAAFASQVVAAAPRLAAAARDAARGISIVFTFTFDSRSALLAKAPSAAAVNILPGWHHD